MYFYFSDLTGNYTCYMVLVYDQLLFNTLPLTKLSRNCREYETDCFQHQRSITERGASLAL